MLQIFIGYLLLFLHFKINGFDLLPDFLGFIFIFAGLGKLSEESNYFKKARPFSVIMAVIEVVSLALMFVDVELNLVISNSLRLVAAAMSLYIMFCIIKGIGDIEKNHNESLGYDKMMTVWKVSAVLQITTVLLTFFANELILAVLSVLIVGSLIVHIVFLVYLYRAKKAYDNIPPYSETEAEPMALQGNLINEEDQA